MARSDAYIIKLFDRSVDLAQFSSSTPLYPICRAWMRNNPTAREQAVSPSPPHSAGEDEVSSCRKSGENKGLMQSHLFLITALGIHIAIGKDLFTLFQVADMQNGKGQNYYRLPLPSPSPLSPSGDPVNLRIPDKPAASKVSGLPCTPS